MQISSLTDKHTAHVPPILLCIQDKRVTPQEWSALKADAPFGQLPVLYIDGKPLAQSPAIDRYVAKITGFLPDDPLTAALADQAYFFVEDVWQPM
jgi:glutathione S-transferase